MTNREKFADEILDIACSAIAVSSKTGEPKACDGMNCDECMFCKSCTEEAIKAWANAEYIERHKISKKDRDFLEYIGDEYKYVARDRNGELFVYGGKPSKVKNGMWYSRNTSQTLRWLKVDFPMIKWEDEEPWLIEDLKKLEVVDEYEDN